MCINSVISFSFSERNHIHYTRGTTLHCFSRPNAAPRFIHFLHFPTPTVIRIGLEFLYRTGHNLYSFHIFMEEGSFCVCEKGSALQSTLLARLRTSPTVIQL